MMKDESVAVDVAGEGAICVWVGDAVAGAQDARNIIRMSVMINLFISKSFIPSLRGGRSLLDEVISGLTLEIASLVATRSQ